MRVLLLILLSTLGFAGGLFGMYLGLRYVSGAGGAEELDEPASERTAAEALEQRVGAGDMEALLALDLADPAADSLALLRKYVSDAQRALPRVLARIDTLEQALQARQDRQQRARELAATLPRLEDRELRSLLAQLDADVLVDIYAEASPRNRTRLLGALPAARGAALVERIAGLERGAPGPSDGAAVGPPPGARPASAPPSGPGEGPGARPSTPAAGAPGGPSTGRSATPSGTPATEAAPAQPIHTATS
ncbi:MAG: hypothetical protein ACK41D_02350 [Rubricoccaceae bacterium]